MFGVVFLAPYARTTRYEESVLPKGKKRPRSLRSLGLASLFWCYVYRSSNGNLTFGYHDSKSADIDMGMLGG